MKKLLTGLLSVCLAASLFFSMNITSWAAEGDEDTNTINPYERVEAEDANYFAYSYKANSADGSPCGAVISTIGYIVFQNVDFGEGTDTINVCAQAADLSPLWFMVDSLKDENTSEGKIEVTPSEGLEVYNVKLNTTITGVHTIYIGVPYLPNMGGMHYVNVDYWVAEKPPVPEPTPELTLEYDVYCWGSGYKVDFKVVNNSDEDVVGWALKIKKNGHSFDHSWCVNVKDDGDYFIVTPLDWNSVIPANGTVEFGILSSDNVGVASEYEFIDPVPVEDEKLGLDYSIQSWDDGYNVNFTLTNNSDTQLNGWTLKLNKSDINITSSWSVNVEETDDYYILTPAGWNTIVGPHDSTTFGIQGSGEIGTEIGYELEEMK
ncbi:Cellulose binding domain-containing protein [Pseudobutyrivibrio sp. 49]|uniref:cellulose binding domain-containing protein n=1 Tax=Pseudobutyrivibrio sp. 49 TaxID=1855344 RepID=UPI00088996A2|nr:cellulose binding domain-containing protein [Pseudobutyrivibrio sp. 49]SDI73453.1 Cellulose binding domain-containing protein [Pseudobutyrivibrio sp. 49]